MRAMALEAANWRASRLQVTPMTRENLAASFMATSITPVSLAVTGETARMQLTGVSFANLVGWLDVRSAAKRAFGAGGGLTAQDPAGQVDATLTLRQDTGAPAP
jgi:general secretion pathway protein M